MLACARHRLLDVYPSHGRCQPGCGDNVLKKVVPRVKAANLLEAFAVVQGAAQIERRLSRKPGEKEIRCGQTGHAVLALVYRHSGRINHPSTGSNDPNMRIVSDSSRASFDKIRIDGVVIMQQQEVGALR